MLYSVVIPSYNRKALLAQAIDSVLMQGCRDLEIIVVDDGSSDGTAEMIIAEYPTVRYFSQPNQGPAAARNRGIAAARGELVAFLDSDDIWSANKVEVEVSMLRRFPDAIALAGNADVFVEGALHSADTFAERGIRFLDSQPRFFDWSLSIMKFGPVCCTSSLTLRNSALQRLGRDPYDATLRVDEDWDLEFRIFTCGKVVLYPQLVCTRRMFDDDTRDSYSIKGKAKTVEEQVRTLRRQKTIILRYMDGGLLDAETGAGFRQRVLQIDDLLRERGAI